MDVGDAERWVDARLAERAERRTGPVELVRSRPWGEVAKAESSVGTVWLKAPGPTTSFEVPLYGLLDKASPRSVLTPLGVDPERGWVLLPDGGPTLGERTEGAARVEGLIATLRRYARVQRDMEPYSDRLLEMGIADMRPQLILTRFDEAVAFSRHYAKTSGSERDMKSVEEVATHRGSIAKWAAELERAPGRATLDHNDLHPWNVLGNPEQPETIRFYDWGDATVAHPFASAALPLGMIEREQPRALSRARDAYLDAFQDVGAHADLVRILELACRCAKVARAHTWERAIRLAGKDAPEDFRRAPLESLESVLDETYTSRT